MRVLVVAAHPDDEVLGCGATIARLTDAEHEVAILIVGEGATSRRGSSEATGEVARLRANARLAAGDLGVRRLDLLGLPDNRLDTVPLLDIVHEIESIVDDVGPSVVFTHHPGDLNIDHAVVHRAVLTATRPLPGSVVERVISFEVPSASEWSFHRLGPPFAPNLFVDVSATLDRKLEALARYDTEARPAPHPRAPQSIRAAAVHRGAAAGLLAAEAFEVVRDVRGPSALI